MVNLEIREEIVKSRVKMWEIAERMGIQDCSLSRKFRKELSNSQKAEIRRIIREIKEGDNYACTNQDA